MKTSLFQLFFLASSQRDRILDLVLAAQNDRDIPHSSRKLGIFEYEQNLQLSSRKYADSERQFSKRLHER